MRAHNYYAYKNYKTPGDKDAEPKIALRPLVREVDGAAPPPGMFFLSPKVGAGVDNANDPGPAPAVGESGWRAHIILTHTHPASLHQRVGRLETDLLFHPSSVRAGDGAAVEFNFQPSLCPVPTPP